MVTCARTDFEPVGTGLRLAVWRTSRNRPPPLWDRGAWLRIMRQQEEQSTEG